MTKCDVCLVIQKEEEIIDLVYKDVFLYHCCKKCLKEAEECLEADKQ